MFNKMTKNVLNISALENRPSISAEELKATFDRAGVDIKEAFNGLVEQLASETAGEHIGVDVESVATKTLQAVLTAFDEAIANRYTKTEVDTEVSQETNNLVKDFNIFCSALELSQTKPKSPQTIKVSPGCNSFKADFERRSGSPCVSPVI